MNGGQKGASSYHRMNYISSTSFDDEGVLWVNSLPHRALLQRSTDCEMSRELDNLVELIDYLVYCIVLLLTVSRSADRDDDA